MSKVFLISDTHWNDPSIIRYERHQYSNVEDMNDDIINKWKHKVGSDDLVIHCGDIGYNSSGCSRSLKEIITGLPGEKMLIMGNHDRIYKKSELYDFGFSEVHRFPICYEEFYWLSHKPMYLNAFMPYVNIHGHLHGCTINMKAIVNQFVNVSWDQMLDDGPIDFESIKSSFERRKIMSKREKAEAFEGEDILYYLERDINEIQDDELTKGRIRSIFIRLKYGQNDPTELAEYYNLPLSLIRDIGSGKIFGEITKGTGES